MKDCMNTFERKVLNFIREKAMAESGDTVIVGLSGGADSVALISVLSELKSVLGISIYALHVNHGIRGKAADADENFAKELCERLQVPFESVYVDVPAIAKKEKLTEEEAGRMARYSAFAEAARKLSGSRSKGAGETNEKEQTEKQPERENGRDAASCIEENGRAFGSRSKGAGETNEKEQTEKQPERENGRDAASCIEENSGKLCVGGGIKIAVAHHENDVAETLLMNLARGTGLKGASSIRPVRGNIIRPLLCVTRQEIEEYLAEKGLTFCTDLTNLENDHTRNVVRNLILPELTDKVNSQTIDHFVRAAESFAEADEYIAEVVERRFSEMAMPLREPKSTYADVRRTESVPASSGEIETAPATADVRSTVQVLEKDINIKEDHSAEKIENITENQLTETKEKIAESQSTEIKEKAKEHQVSEKNKVLSAPRLPSGYAIDQAEFLKEPGIIRRGIILLAIEKVVGTRKDITERHLRAAEELFSGRAGSGSINLPYGLVAARSYEKLQIRLCTEPVRLQGSRRLSDAKHDKKHSKCNLPDMKPVEEDSHNRPATTETDGSTDHNRPADAEKDNAAAQRCSSGTNPGRRPMDNEQGTLPPSPCIPIELAPGQEMSILIPGLGDVQIAVFPYDREKEIPRETYTKWFDYDRIQEVVFRTGDRGDVLEIEQNGSIAAKRLSKFMTDIKLPRDERDSQYILADGNRVLWVVGYRIGASFKVTDRTENILAVKIIPEVE